MARIFFEHRWVTVLARSKRRPRKARFSQRRGTAPRRSQAPRGITQAASRCRSVLTPSVAAWRWRWPRFRPGDQARRRPCSRHAPDQLPADPLSADPLSGPGPRDTSRRRPLRAATVSPRPVHPRVAPAGGRCAWLRKPRPLPRYEVPGAGASNVDGNSPSKPPRPRRSMPAQSRSASR